MEIKSDLTGRKFGLLTVQKHSHDGAKGHHYWECSCACGNTKIVRGNHLYTHAISSCGCLKRRRGKNHPAFGGYEEISGDYLSALQRGAKTRQHQWALNAEYLWNLFIKQNRCCALSGVPLTFAGSVMENRYAATSQKTASLDRIDPEKGYIHGNVQWIHKDLNFMKGTMNEAEFLEWCQKIVNFKIPA